MRYKIIILFFTLILIRGGLSAQTSFYRTYGHSSYFEGVDLFQIPNDSSYYLLGNHSGFSGAKSIYLLKTDSMGIPIWDVSIGDSRNYEAKSMFLSKDSFIYIIGNVYNFSTSYDILLLKLDLQANIIWEKNFGSSGWDFGIGIDTISSDSIVIAANTYSYGNQTANFLRLVVNENGDSLEQILYESPDEQKIHEIRRTSRGFLFCGENAVAASNPDALILHTDIAGDTLFHLIFGDTATDIAYSGFEINSNEFFITGIYTNTANSLNENDLRLLLDSSANLLNDPYLFYNTEKSGGYHCISLGTNYNLICGYDENFGAGKADGRILHLDNNGYFINGSTVGSHENEYLYKVILSVDSGIAAIGTSWGFGDAISNIQFIKTQSNAHYNFSTYQHYTNIEDIDDTKTNPLSFFPNPVKRGINIEIRQDYDKLIIFNLKGQEVARYYKQRKIQTTNLIPSIYFIHFFKDEKISVEKLIVY
jgi:hypothetical protein